MPLILLTEVSMLPVINSYSNHLWVSWELTYKLAGRARAAARSESYRDWTEILRAGLYLDTAMEGRSECHYCSAALNSWSSQYRSAHILCLHPETRKRCVVHKDWQIRCSRIDLHLTFNPQQSSIFFLFLFVLLRIKPGPHASWVNVLPQNYTPSSRIF